VSDRVAQGTDGRALAQERAIHAAAGLLQEILGDAQLALERSVPRPALPSLALAAYSASAAADSS
jgi:hypothetical protein